MLFNFFEFCTYSCQAEFEYSDSAEEAADYYQLCPSSDLSLHLQPAGHPSNDHRRGHHPQAVLSGESHQDLGRGEAEPTQTCQPCNFISLSPVLIDSRTFIFEYNYIQKLLFKIILATTLLIGLCSNFSLQLQKNPKKLFIKTVLFKIINLIT